MIYDPEEGWDDSTETHGVVLDYDTQEEVRRKIAFTARMVSPKPALNNDFAFQKVFGDGEFIAAGQLIIPVGGKKPSKGTKDNTYVFFVIEGAVSVKIHCTSFIVATGGMFLIPRGNNYYIENVSQRSARLFFTQARKVNAEVKAPPDVQPASALPKSVDLSRPPSESTANEDETPVSGLSSNVWAFLKRCSVIIPRYRERGEGGYEMGSFKGIGSIIAVLYFLYFMSARRRAGAQR